MQTVGNDPSRFDLAQHGLSDIQTAYWNLGTAHLYEQAMQRGEGVLAGDGAFVVRTGASSQAALRRTSTLFARKARSTPCTGDP
jgi:ATP-dependent phosphoenolpyruvate carboxykinase